MSDVDVLRISNEGYGGYVTKKIFSMQTIASGSSGVLFTLTAPAGRRVRIENLSSISTVSGISVSVDGEDLCSGFSLTASPDSSNEFAINQSGHSAVSANALNFISDVVGSEITVSSASATSQSITYTYSEGI